MRAAWAAVLLPAVFAGCDGVSLVDPAVDAPDELAARAEWTLTGWRGTEPAGHPAVTLEWLVPSRWNGEPFRVYGRRSSGSGYSLIATVTSCDAGRCVYRDVNVAPGTSYDYFVAAVDEASNEEASSAAVRVDVPANRAVATPTAPRTTALDNALYLQWTDGGVGDRLQKYLVYLVALNDSSVLYQLGETDAAGHLDLRARNGVKYTYRVAAVDFDGYVSSLSAPMSGIPRPDARAELLYAHQSRPDSSGFRFRAEEDLVPVVPGASAEAQWRLEASDAGWFIRPLGGTGVYEAGRTTDLVCGPAADSWCSAVREANAGGYQTTPVAVRPEHSYVFRVGASGAPNYGVVRVTHWGTTTDGRSFIVFDWAYQTRPGSRDLMIGASR